LSDLTCVLPATMSDQQHYPPAWRSKTVPIVAVIALHVAIFVAILVSSRTVRQFVDLADSLVMILLPEPESLPETTPPAQVVQAPRLANPEQLPVQSPQVNTAPADSTAPVALPQIDWQQEMERSAKKKADATPWQSAVPKAKKPKSEFGWSHARTNRIEHDKATGATVFNINDHCALLYFLIPVCRLGKIKPRGDLFEGMNDPDRPGSVPDAPKSDVAKSD
jgi:hypothetical protein